MEDIASSTTLAREAAFLSPIFTQWNELYLSGVLKSYDFVGSFILAYAATRRPRRWDCGKIDPPILQVSSTQLLPPSIKVNSVPELMNMLDMAKLRRYFPSRDMDEISILDVFNRIRISGIKKNNDNLVNRAVLLWAAGQWPFELLTFIPTPMQVLRMQALGTRVVTLFYKENELASYHVAKLTYMSGMKIASKNAFDFLVHDLTHMEHFIHADSHLEQRGFMYCLERMNNGRPRHLFNALFPGDTIIWQELEYLISDMNCYLPHLFKYLMAKVLGACTRRFFVMLHNQHILMDSHIGDGALTMSDLSHINTENLSIFYKYCRLVWTVVLSELRINPNTEPFLAGLYYLLKFTFESHSNYISSAPTIPTANDLRSVNVDEECQRICAHALSASRAKDVAMLLDSVSGFLASDFDPLMESTTLDDVTAGEALRRYFQSIVYLDDPR